MLIRQAIFKMFIINNLSHLLNHFIANIAIELHFEAKCYKETAQLFGTTRQLSTFYKIIS